MKKTSYKILGLLLLIVGCTGLFSLKTSAATAFVTTWQTDKSTAGVASITIPTDSNQVYDYAVNWGDNSTSVGQTGSATHTYATAGTYTVSITGKFPRIYFNNGPESLKILEVNSWGSIEWKSMVDAFEGCANLTVPATNAPDLSEVSSLSGMFRGAIKFNQPINHWNISNVTSIANMFERATSFNQPLNNWNTSNVIMFSSAFRRASSFNQNIQSWNTSKAKSMYAMFAYATSFNQPLNNWNMSSVNDVRDMFGGATSFDQNLSGWNMANVIRTESMFRNAIQFNQDVSAWNFGKVTNAGYMFSGTRLSGINYDKLLAALANGSTLNDVEFDAGSSTYCTAGESRRKLVEEKRWIVRDQGQDPNSCSPVDVRFESGVGAVVEENQPAGTVVGKLKTTHPNAAQTFTYSFCQGGTFDQQFFELNGDTIKALRSFDFEKPVDENKDGVFNLCIISTDSTGAKIQRVVTVAVSDVEETDTSNGQGGTGGNSPGSGNGQSTPSQTGVLGTNTDESKSVLGKVLGATGVAGLVIILLGVGIIGTVVVLFIRSRHKEASKFPGLK